MGEFADPRVVAVCLATSISGASIWLLNVTVYPSFNDFFPLARDIATSMDGILSLLLALVAMRAPRPFAARGTLAFAVVLGLAGTFGMFAGSAAASPVLATVSACARGAAGIVGSVYTVFALIALSPGASLVALVMGHLLEFAWVALLGALPAGVQGALLPVCNVLPFLVLAPVALPSLARVAGAASPHELSVTNPLSFIPFTSRLFIAVLLFDAAMGFALTYGSHDSVPAQTAPVLGLFAIVMLIVILRRTTSLDALYALSFTIVLAGLLLIPGMSAIRTAGAQGTLALSPSLANSLLNVGASVVSILVNLTAAALGRRNLSCALSVSLMFSMAGGLGTELGAASGHLQNFLEGADVELAALFAAGIALVFALYNFNLVSQFSFEAAVAEVRPAAPVPVIDEASARAARIDERCAELADRYRLSPRESEVLALLARGRNAAYIQESLSISRNTVKSYVAHVYTKLGVHSHQEVIDLVEEQGAGGTCG